MAPSNSNQVNVAVSHKRVMYQHPVARHALSTTLQLRPTTARLGDPINLHAEFKSQGTFYWYKTTSQHTIRLSDSKHIIVTNSSKSSKLLIKEATRNDDGLYYVVCKSIYGIMSSLAQVTVSESECARPVPEVINYLPEDIEINYNEESRMVCRIVGDQKVNVTWFLKGQELASDSTVAHLDFGSHYIGLRWINASQRHSTSYCLVLKDVDTELETETSFIVGVIRPHQLGMPTPPPVEPVRLLESAAAAVGARVVFECSFNIQKYPFYFVVWYVGRYKIERSNSLFEVISYGTQHLLYVKKLDTSMGGEVICELRRALPRCQSVFVSRSTAQLSIVPEQFLDDEISAVAINVGPRVYMADVEGPNSHGAEPYVGGRRNIEDMWNHPILDIVYCRLEEDEVYYSDMKSLFADLAPSITVRQSYDYFQDYDVQFAWTNPEVENMWYALEIEAADGSLQLLVHTVEPSFTLNQPPIGRLARILVSAIRPLNLFLDTDVRIDLPKARLNPMRPVGRLGLQLLHLFPVKYTSTSAAVLGEGAFGKVTLVKNGDGEYLAAKYIQSLTEQKREAALREYEVMTKLTHKKIVQLVDVFVDPDIRNCIFVMEFLWGGELFERIASEDYFNECDVIPYVRQILKALKYMHSRHIAHLDLKPENIMCVSPNTNKIKLVDFGLARVIVGAKGVNSIYGSRDYVSPEVLNMDRITVACDMWSMGVVTFTLLSGTTPFPSDNWAEQTADISSGRYSYTDPAFEDVSLLARNFVDQLLVVKPQERMTAYNALEHPWVRRGPPNNVAADMTLARRNLKQYLQTSKEKWQRAGNLMIAASRFRRGLERIRRYIDAATINEDDTEDDPAI